jgi:Uma2 family endonuclease
MTDKQAVAENVLAKAVTFETFMEYFADRYTEWLPEGIVIKLSPVTRKHDMLFQFLIQLFRVYLDATKAGLLMTAPFVMRVKPKSSGREPDLHIVLAERAAIVHDTITEGPADVVIEIISEETVERDTVTKFGEYEAGGVREYWLLDSLNDETFFYELDGIGHYQLISLEDGVFRSKILSHFLLDVRLLWQCPMPDGKQIDAMVAAMLKEDQ